MTIHAVKPWDSPDPVCPFALSAASDPLTRQWTKQGDTRYTDRNLCRHPECNAWIRNDSRTCKQHRQWYDQAVRYPARRLVQLLELAEQRGDLGACPAIVLGEVGGHEVGEIAPDLERVLDE